MAQHVLITGGAGFIGSHLARELLEQGYRVRILDALLPQVHGSRAQRPAYLADDAELIIGDVRDRAAVRAALEGVNAVYHLAAAVGVGQSMYEIAEYTGINNLGTAVLMEELIEAREHIERLIVASSMSLYGEGLYRTCDGKIAEAAQRTLHQLRAHEWDPRDEQGNLLTPLPTPETKPPSLWSVYALCKYDQERMCLMIGQAYAIPTVALRFFNVYGPDQALSNPYTGVLAIFASRLLNDQPPIIFEDGRQQRDFVNVRDVARACRLALEVPDACGRAINVGSGKPMAVRQVAARMAQTLGKSIEPQITARYRVGDIRHCFADITQARKLLGYEPQVDFEDGLAELAHWLEGQVAFDRVAEARAELEARGLAI